jgi:hypothetical protein
MARDLSYRAVGRCAARLDLPCLTTDGEGRAGASTSYATAGHRARAIYALTQAGREMFQLLLREGWQQVPRTFPSNLCTLLTFSHHLPSEERRAGLQTMLAALEKELAQWGEGEQAKREAISFPIFLQAVFDNGREHLEANIRLVQRLLEDPSTSRKVSEER